MGHIRPNCPDFYKSNAEQPEEFGGAAYAFPAYGRLYHEKYYNVSTIWVVDSGANRNFSANVSDFTNLRPISCNHHVKGIE
jgi:hypothetical protein